MSTRTIADAFTENDRIREKLKGLVNGISDETANFLSENSSWSIANIVEHLCVVESGMSRIAAKLLKKAESEGRISDGSLQISKAFVQKVADAENRKFEAPEMVRPTAGRTISESLSLMEENRARLNELRAKFETVEGTVHTFPHPLFGDLTAHDWLTLIGGHEERHIKQIERILEEFEAKKKRSG